jgi:hypothetical protein
MAATVKAMDTFKVAFSGLITVEDTKRGLSKTFHSAVIDLLNENPTLSGEEAAKLFLETLTEVENTLRSEIVAVFGPDAEVKTCMPSWVQYKSDYKRALEEVHRSDIMKCNGVAAVKGKLTEVRQAMKEKASGSTDGNPADNDGGKAGGAKTGVGHRLPEAVQAMVDEYIATLSKLDDADALEVATRSCAAAFAKMRLGKKKGAAMGVTGSSNKAAANG